jgi:hypothetical protein
MNVTHGFRFLRRLGFQCRLKHEWSLCLKSPRGNI